MNQQEQALVNKLIEEIYQFRGEMKSFKEQTMERLKAVETRCETRQNHPETCVIGRSLSTHTKNHQTQGRKNNSTVNLMIQAGMLAAVILIAVFK